jgi:hypothetical protein
MHMMHRRYRKIVGRRLRKSLCKRLVKLILNHGIEVERYKTEPGVPFAVGRNVVDAALKTLAD